MPRLAIPYRSQWASDAANNSADCGPTSVAMILNYFQNEISPDGVYAFLPPKEPEDFTYIYELRSVLQAHGLQVTRQQYAGWEDAFANLKANIDSGKPMIALVKYKPWMGPTGNPYQWGHFVVITGYDDTHVYMHDPLFGLWVTPPEKGAHFVLAREVFAAGWGGFSDDENPNWVALVVEKAAVPQPAPEPQPEPQPEAEPVPSPEPAVEPEPEVTPEAPPTPAALTMEDIERRIEALAAYRWTNPPDFSDEAAVKLWRDHLGDWGLTYDEYVVQPGDTLVGLAQRFFGQAHRWPAIKAYNNLRREGLWVGETLKIPHLGESNAHKDPALPSDTIAKPRSLVIEGFADPRKKALDYDALGSGSIGIGFGE